MKHRGDHVVLVGLRCVGKTTVGRKLAARLGRPFIDVDDGIAEISRRPAGELLASAGEERFRKIEERALRRAVAGKPAVIATGGGAVTRPSSRRILARSGCVVWLRVAAQETIRRLRRSRGRPPLTALPLAEEVRSLARRRRPLYRSVATITIRCGRASPAALAARIARLVADGSCR